VWGTVLLAGLLCLVTFYAKGGAKLETMTSTEIGLTLGAGLLFAVSVLLRGRTGAPRIVDALLLALTA
jgi:hypothetical protein